MANRFPLVLDTTDNNKIKEIQAGDNLNLTDNSITGVQNITALGTIDAADVRVNGNRLVAQAFADLTDTPASFIGSPNYFVKVKADGTGLEYRPLSDLGNIEIDTITVDTSIVPSVDGAGNVGTEAAKFNEIVAATLKGNLVAFDETIVFNATTGKISYAALQGAPTFLSEFTDDVGYLRAADLDDSLSGLFDEGQQFVTDIQGSVFGDDSTLLVDAVASKIVGDIDFGTTTGFIQGDDIAILPTNGGTLNLGLTRILEDITPIFAQGGSVGTEELPFNEANFVSANITTVSTDAINLNEAIGVAQLTATTDLEITAGNRVKIEGGVPFKFSSTDATNQLAIGAQEGDVIYNTTTSRLQMYQGGVWKDVNGNVEATTGVSNFNDVTIAGNLTVQGTTTTVDTDNTTIKDNVIVLNNGEAGAGVTAGTSGIEIDRGSEANKTLVWDETEDYWTIGSEILKAGTIDTVGVKASVIDNNGGPLQIKAGDVSDTGNTIFINPYGDDTYLTMQAENYFLKTGPYLSLSDPYIEFTTAGAFEALQGAYFVGDVTGNLTGDVVGSVFGDDSTTIVDAVGNNLNANKLTVDTVESTSGLILLSQGGINMTATTSALLRSFDGDFIIQAAGGWTELVGNGGGYDGNVSVNGDNGVVSLGSTNYVEILSGVGAPINIGTGTSGDVNIGNNTNSVNFASGTTVDFDGVTVSNFSGNVTGNIDNTTLDIGTTDATAINIGNDSSAIVMDGTLQLNSALIVNNLIADDSISITTADGDGNGISLGPQGTNTAVNLTADSIRFFGPVTTEIQATVGIIGDVKGSIFGDDSTVLVDAVNNSIPYGVLDGAPTALSQFSNDLDYAAIIGTQLTIQGLPVDTLMTGTLDAQGNNIVDANLVNATGDLQGDVVGSVFADDSSKMVDAVEFAMFADTISLTPLSTEPGTIVEGMVAIADGVSWDPLTTGVKTMMVYLDSEWRQIATA